VGLLVNPSSENLFLKVYSVIVSDHRGSNSQLIDFEGVEIRSVFAAKMKKAEKSNT
jgi:hypothetical protein